MVSSAAVKDLDEVRIGPPTWVALSELADNPNLLVLERTGKVGFLCLNCGMTSWNSHDLFYRFCAHCKEYHEGYDRADAYLRNMQAQKGGHISIIERWFPAAGLVAGFEPEIFGFRVWLARTSEWQSFPGSLDHSWGQEADHSERAALLRKFFAWNPQRELWSSHIPGHSSV